MEEDGGHGWEEVYAAYGCSPHYEEDFLMERTQERDAVPEAPEVELLRILEVETTSVGVERVRSADALAMLPSPR